MAWTTLKPMYLPTELVLNIITQTLPTRQNVILQPSHPITQTLLAFTLVCHETRKLANRYLMQYCVYLSSKPQLLSLVLQLQNRPDFGNIHSLMLKPFEELEETEQLSAATLVRDLFHYTHPSLKRLVTDIPRPNSLFRGPMEVRSVLKDGFDKLENLEEFVSIRYELYFDPETYNDRFDGPVWKNWSKLKKLALYEPDIDEPFWKNIASLLLLETLVLTQPNVYEFADLDLKSLYFTHTDRPLKLLIIDVEEETQVWKEHVARKEWDIHDPQRKMTIMTYSVPRLYPDEDPMHVCQEFVRAGSENGTLWGWEGDVVQHLVSTERVSST